MKKELKAIIVEDEEASRETLKNYLAKYCPEVQLMDIAASVDEGFVAIKKHQPQIVFLDIEMPFGNAFDLLARFVDIDFEIIFVTAYKDYAMKALNLSAAYYILKPIDIDELIFAVNKIRKHINTKDEFLSSKVLLQNIRSANQADKKIVIPQMDGFEVIAIKDIIKGEASDNYTTFYLENGSRYIVSKTLKHFEELLGDFDFLRVHKSWLINKNFIIKYKKGKGGEVILSDGTTAPISPTYKRAFLESFKQL